MNKTIYFIIGNGFSINLLKLPTLKMGFAP